VSAESSIRDFVTRWLRPAFWVVVSFALGCAVVAAIVFVPAFLMEFLFVLLCWRWPFLNRINIEWVVAVSSTISLGLGGIFVYMDMHKWHIGDRLQRLREGKGRDKPSQ